MFEMRSMLEGLAARKAAERASEYHQKKMAQIIEKLDEIADLNAPSMRADFVEENRNFHDALFEASGSRKLMEIIARFVEQAIVVRTASDFTPDDVRSSNQYHKDILSAIRAKNGMLAENLMRVHILKAGGRYQDGHMT